MALTIDVFPVGTFQCNCTILGCEETGEAIVIDPGDEIDEIREKLTERGLKIQRIIHTHAHLDHIGATGALKHHCGGDITLHKSDLYLYDAQAMQAQMLGIAEPEHQSRPDDFIEHADPIRWGRGNVMKTIHTPGHTPGSVSFHLDSPNQPILFTGDTLFMGSIGRTDLPGGDYAQIMRSIRDQLLPFDDTTVVIPGHGPTTDIGREKKINPFVRELL